MEQRRFKDIVAFRLEHEAPFAFHARNLEVAEISEEAWQGLSETHVNTVEIEREFEAWETEANPDVKSGKVELGIRSLTINVTQICNLKCTYCAAGGDGTYGAAQTKINVEKTLPQLKFFLDKTPRGGKFRITFLGGEPLLYPQGILEIANYVELMTVGRDIKVFFSVVTNGTLINEKTLPILKKIRAMVTVSLDGPPDINDRMRPSKDGSGSTSIVVEGIQKLSQIKDKLGGPLIVHGVFTKENMSVVSAYNFYRNLNVDKFEFTYSVNESDKDLSAEFVNEMNAIAKIAYDIGGENELRRVGLFNQYFYALDNQQQTENFCGAGKSYLMIDAQNNIYTCPWDVGNKVEQVGFGSEVLPNKMASYEAPLIEANNCQSCWARFLCGGGCMFIHKHSTGSKNKKDEKFCLRTRALISTALFYYKQCRTIC
jgi:uncharacterized protein